MGDLFKYILQSKDEIKNKSVLTIIDESESEYGANVYDPYSGM